MYEIGGCVFIILIFVLMLNVAYYSDITEINHNQMSPLTGVKAKTAFSCFNRYSGSLHFVLVDRLIHKCAGCVGILKCKKQHFIVIGSSISSSYQKYSLWYTLGVCLHLVVQPEV